MAPESVAWQALTAAALFAALSLAGAWLSREPLAQRLGLGRGRLDLGAGARGIVGLLGLSHAADAALTISGWRGGSALARLDHALSGLGPVEVLFPLAALALGAACAEELFFRGLLQRGLAQRLGEPIAITVVAVVFGAVHGDAAHGVAAFTLGRSLGALAARAGSIRLCMAGHAINNAVAVLEVANGWRVPGGEIPALIGGIAVALWGLWGLRSQPAAAEA